MIIIENQTAHVELSAEIRTTDNQSELGITEWASQVIKSDLLRQQGVDLCLSDAWTCVVENGYLIVNGPGGQNPYEIRIDEQGISWVVVNEDTRYLLQTFVANLDSAAGYIPAATPEYMEVQVLPSTPTVTVAPEVIIDNAPTAETYNLTPVEVVTMPSGEDSVDFAKSKKKIVDEILMMIGGAIGVSVVGWFTYIEYRAVIASINMDGQSGLTRSRRNRNQSSAVHRAVQDNDYEIASSSETPIRRNGNNGSANTQASRRNLPPLFGTPPDLKAFDEAEQQVLRNKVAKFARGSSGKASPKPQRSSGPNSRSSNDGGSINVSVNVTNSNSPVNKMDIEYPSPNPPQEDVSEYKIPVYESFEEFFDSVDPDSKSTPESDAREGVTEEIKRAAEQFAQQVASEADDNQIKLVHPSGRIEFIERNPGTSDQKWAFLRGVADEQNRIASIIRQAGHEFE